MSKYSELVERLRGHATDWNGAQMPDLEPAKADPTAGTLRLAADAITKLEAEKAELLEALQLAIQRFHYCAAVDQLDRVLVSGFAYDIGDLLKRIEDAAKLEAGQ